MNLYRSGEVFSRLSDSRFQNFWDQLYENCPWKTAFQSRPFVQTWYEQYRETYEPILLVSEDPSAPALLPLALRGRDLVVAGAHQAEYQAWLATSGDAAFFSQALRLLRERLKFGTLTFKYLPPGFPVEALGNHSVEVQSVPRPLMTLNPPDKILESLKKKSNKSRFNALKRRGDVVLEHVTNPQAFREIFDEIILMYDFRQGAINNSFPFEEDSRKKPFHLALAEVPGLLHISVLKQNEKVIAAQIGLCSGTTVHLGIFANSPLLGEFSPGKFHLLLLGSKLNEEGFRVFDLTPGGDEWKERFATEHDTVHIATAHESRSAFQRHKVAQQLGGSARQLLVKVGVTPQHLKTIWQKAKEFRIQKLVRKFRLWLKHDVDLRLYRMLAENVKDLPGNSGVAKDNLQHLLLFRPSESWQTRNKFLSSALERLESGKQHVYTRSADGRLIHFEWMIEREEKSFFSEVQQTFEFPKNSAVLYDAYTHPSYRGRGYFQKGLHQMLHDAVGVPETEYVYIVVMADNGASRHVVEKLGFPYIGSIFHVRRMGKSKHWSTVLNASLSA